MVTRLLSVSYDEPLLRTREILLCRQGYSVTSALGFIAAVDECKAGEFDLLILGHSIPHADKVELVHTFRTHCPAPVLALRHYGDAPLPGADAQIFPDDIEGLLNKVKSMLRNRSERSKHLDQGKQARRGIQRPATP